MHKRHLLLTLLAGFAMMSIASNLPQIRLDYTVLDKDTFNMGTFQFIEGEDTMTLPMKIRHRGSNALYYDKPSYAIKLLDSLGQNLDTAFLGLRSDNYWILDAMASDKARMRNRVSMDLWLEFSRKPWYYDLEPKLINGYRGRMVEVYKNDSTQGIYCLMERVDRKQLKLKKYSEKKGIQGLLYKATSNLRTSAFYLSSEARLTTKSTWDSWEIKYPDLEDGEPITWEPLYHLLYVVNKTAKSNFKDSIDTYLDIPVLVDYVLFCQLLSARDNVGKNAQLSYYKADTKKAVYTPWDLDHSWGRQYNGSAELTNHILFDKHNLFVQSKTKYPSLQDSLKNRWQELRQTVFTIGHIDSLFAPYFELYALTGIDTLEQHIWSGHNDLTFDIASEQVYIHNWVAERLAFLDSIYQYEPYTPTGMTTNNCSTANQVSKYIINNHFYIEQKGCRYDCLGRPLKRKENP